MEKVSLLFSNIKTLIYFPHITLIEILIYYIFLLYIIKTKNKKLVLVLFIIVFSWKIKPLFNSSTEIYFIDVGQGDSILIITPHRKKSILIDTGGKITFNKESWQIKNKNFSIAKSSLIPLMRNLGVNKLDYLFITHGDQDHGGEALNLINNFKVNKIYINKGEENKLENKIFNKVKINFDTIKIDNLEIHSLNKEIFNNENDNSIVLLIKVNTLKILLMGDGSIKTENSILKKYNLNEIDILKVGHHGSKTSSGKNFIKEIKPKINIISSGLNNRFNHPHEETINLLKKHGKIYNTAKNGTIKIKINKHLKITTYDP